MATLSALPGVILMLLSHVTCRYLTQLENKRKPRHRLSERLKFHLRSAPHIVLLEHLVEVVLERSDKKINDHVASGFTVVGACQQCFAPSSYQQSYIGAHSAQQV
jgi:hypothetical protein